MQMYHTCTTTTLTYFFVQFSRNNATEYGKTLLGVLWCKAVTRHISSLLGQGAKVLCNIVVDLSLRQYSVVDSWLVIHTHHEEVCLWVHMGRVYLPAGQSLCLVGFACFGTGSTVCFACFCFSVEFFKGLCKLTIDNTSKEVLNIKTECIE